VLSLIAFGFGMWAGYRFRDAIKNIGQGVKRKVWDDRI
jgi:hypothetical protein